jgi:hypothetical protein
MREAIKSRNTAAAINLWWNEVFAHSSEGFATQMQGFPSDKTIL